MPAAARTIRLVRNARLVTRLSEPPGPCQCDTLTFDQLLELLTTLRLDLYERLAAVLPHDPNGEGPEILAALLFHTYTVAKVVSPVEAVMHLEAAVDYHEKRIRRSQRTSLRRRVRRPRFCD